VESPDHKLKDTRASIPPQNNHQLVRKQWIDQQMQNVINDVKGNRLGANAAAREHGIPPSTLKGRFTG